MSATQVFRYKCIKCRPRVHAKMAAQIPEQKTFLLEDQKSIEAEKPVGEDGAVAPCGTYKIKEAEKVAFRAF